MDGNIDMVREALEYVSDTGRFYWKIHTGPSVVGKEAGYVNKRGYRMIHVYGVDYRAGRLAWFLHYGSLPSGVIDHINGNRDDNRIENLRDVSIAVNSGNRVEHRNGHTLGTSFKERQGWCATIKRNKKRIHLGFYPTKEEAGEAYRQAVIRLDGEANNENVH